MFRLWAKLFQAGKLLGDMVVENGDLSVNRTAKVFSALDTVCNDFDLSKPLWLEKNIKDFKSSGKTRFSSDNFIENISFDFLEIQVIEEDPM